MKESIVKKFLSILAFILVLLSGSVTLASETPEWTIDIAHQLLAEGWERGPQLLDSPVVGYAIHFVELERNQVRAMGFDFHLDTAEESPGLWAINALDPASGVKLASSAPNSTAQLKSGSSHKNEVATLDSWLLTTEGKPLQVDISSIRLPNSENEHSEERLAIAILPTRLHSDGKIRTEISLSYETISGTMAELQTTTLVGDKAFEPIAVISREVKVGRRVEYQYFAVYLAGMQIPRELIPNDATFVPMGSIVGLQQFMEESSATRPVEIVVGVSYGYGNFGCLLDGSVPIGHKHRIYGQLSSLPQAVYLVGVEGALNQELFLVAELGSLAGDQASLRLGVRDELHLGEELYLSAAVFPVRFTLNSQKPKLIVNWRVQAEFSRENYGFFYRLDNDLAHIRHNLGMFVRKSNSVGARLSWSWDEINKNVITVGIELRY
ncbi:MAG: hypothetical protein GX971_13235 [Firmicutes bacterium]|nr:hypothetical protein [Bacillota bacterium]